MRRLLADVAFARPGDKGDDADVTLFAPDRATYDALASQVTPDRVKAVYGDLVRGDVTRWEVPGVLALKFLLRGALGGGGPASLRADNLGKALAGVILRLEVEVPDGTPLRARPPADPYADAGWRVGD